MEGTSGYRIYQSEETGNFATLRVCVVWKEIASFRSGASDVAKSVGQGNPHNNHYFHKSRNDIINNYFSGLSRAWENLWFEEDSFTPLCPGFVWRLKVWYVSIEKNPPALKLIYSIIGSSEDEGWVWKSNQVKVNRFRKSPLPEL